jgi:AcrR family transcriptional regulator
LAGGSRREQAKAGRRQRIVDATCDLLREVGFDALSMKLVAARAGVSLSTVYNLFASKQDVLAAVLDRDLVRFAAMVAASPARDPLARAFDAVDIAARLYREDPRFYAAILWRRPAEAADGAIDRALVAPRIRFWQDAIRAIKAAGQLQRSADPELLGTLMSRLVLGAVADWIGGQIAIERLHDETVRGLALMLLPHAAPQAAKWLRAVAADGRRPVPRAAE